jgi:hypothetical protein
LYIKCSGLILEGIDSYLSNLISSKLSDQTEPVQNMKLPTYMEATTLNKMFQIGVEYCNKEKLLEVLLYTCWEMALKTLIIKVNIPKYHFIGNLLVSFDLY